MARGSGQGGIRGMRQEKIRSDTQHYVFVQKFLWGDVEHWVDIRLDVDIIPRDLLDSQIKCLAWRHSKRAYMPKDCEDLYPSLCYIKRELIQIDHYQILIHVI